MSVCVNQKAKEKQTYEEMKRKKQQWYTNRVYERSRNVSHSFTLNEIICYTCRTIKRFVNVFYFLYVYLCHEFKMPEPYCAMPYRKMLCDENWNLDTFQAEKRFK